jgi:hypothetical protein
VQLLKITFLFCFLNISALLLGQHLEAKFDPNLQNYFQLSYPLGDSILRFWSTSDETNHWHFSESFVTDWNVKLNKLETWYPADSVYHSPLIAYARKLFSISFPNGDNIIVANNYDCDFGGASHTLFLEKNRKVKWFVSGYESEPYPYNTKEIGLVAKDVLALQSDDTETVYYNISGDRITYDQEPELYTHIFYHNQFIYGQNQNRWVQLDSLFQENNFNFIDTFLNVIGLEDKYLLQTGTSLLLMDDYLNVSAQNNNFHMVHSACRIGHDIGLIDGNTFFLLDTNLNIIRSIPALPQESMNVVQARHDTVEILSTYNGIHHSDFVIREYVPGSVTMVPELDINLEEVQLPDTVYVDFPTGSPWFIQLNFDTIYFRVRNNGNDTIRNFRLECDWSGENQCVDYQKAWFMDQIFLPPASDTILKLSPFKTDTLLSKFHSPFCFWTESPNGQPDPNPYDNYFCASTKLTVDIKEINTNELVSVGPNPADKGIWLKVDPEWIEKLTFNLFTLDGKLVCQAGIHSDSEFINLEQYNSGFYIVQLVMKNGSSSTQKLVIQH